jgi:hypothetical protein
MENVLSSSCVIPANSDIAGTISIRLCSTPPVVESSFQVLAFESPSTSRHASLSYQDVLHSSR